MRTFIFLKIVENCLSYSIRGIIKNGGQLEKDFLETVYIKFGKLNQEIRTGKKIKVGFINKSVPKGFCLRHHSNLYRLNLKVPFVI